MQEPVYRCIHAACARALPRRVNFCPYCGTGQHAGVDNPAHARPTRPPHVAPAAHAAVAPTTPAPAAAQAAPPPPVAAPIPSPAQSRRERKPVRLRWWLLLLAVVLGLWVADQPRKLEARIDRAIALAAECKLNEAQAELISLRSTRASPEQLQRLQQGLNDASAACERKQQRANAWRETVAAVEGAIDHASFIRAQQRLQAFVRKWGEDSDTRSLKDKIGAARLEWQKSDAGVLEKRKADCLAKGGKWMAGSCW